MPASASIHEDETRTLTLWTIETTDGNADDEVTCVITNPAENKPFYITETFKGSNGNSCLDIRHGAYTT
ncbi:hypothetical protein DPMN_136939 [Dreissena polymorpha]|uniref:Uncharacterized protein n=1 Tax=Dreissena polymorpha TaxID=45954 RepID=A0A9D4JIC2_DREPO|nr:hypothetical protein DPMN_136939 [Dreissena polymorpha]